jgi:hypothetical protein
MLSAGGSELKIKAMKKVSLLISILCVTAIAGFSQQSSLEGTLIDKESGEPLLFANVILYQNGVFVAGVQTDFDGNFELTNLVPGVYDLELQYVGYREKRVEGVVVPADQILVLDLSMEADIICCCCYIPYHPPLIDLDEFGSSTTFRVNEKGLIRQ